MTCKRDTIPRRPSVATPSTISSPADDQLYGGLRGSQASGIDGGTEESGRVCDVFWPWGGEEGRRAWSAVGDGGGTFGVEGPESMDELWASSRQVVVLLV